MEEKVKEAILNLSWNAPQCKQQEAIDFLSSVPEDYYHFFLKENSKKGTWENVIEVIRRIPYPQKRLFIPDLLEHLQDINWPGAEEAIDLLTTFSKSDLTPFLEHSLTEAFIPKDGLWLAGLKLLVNEMGYVPSDFSDPIVFRYLGFADF